MGATINLQPVNKTNWERTLSLSVLPEQQHYVLSVEVSLAKAFVRPEGLTVFPYIICDEDILTGYFCIICDPRSSNNYWIKNFFIDREYQNKGYASKAVPVLIEMVRHKFKNCKRIGVKIEPNNKAAVKLCAKFDFLSTDKFSEGELIHIFELPQEENIAAE